MIIEKVNNSTLHDYSISTKSLVENDKFFNLNLKIQCITRFVDTRFVDKTRFVDEFLGDEKSTNRVRGGFQNLFLN